MGLRAIEGSLSLTVCHILTGFSFSSIPNFQTIQLSPFQWGVKASFHFIQASITFSPGWNPGCSLVWAGCCRAQIPVPGSLTFLLCLVHTQGSLFSLVGRSHRLQLQFNRCRFSLKLFQSHLGEMGTTAQGRQSCLSSQAVGMKCSTESGVFLALPAVEQL